MPASSVTIIAAIARNWAIGRNNAIPWNVPEDMRLFRENTVGRTVVMGRLTAESLGRALPKRRNLVVTSRDTAPFDGMEIVRSLSEAVEKTDGELVVIGGSRLYKEALNRADKLLFSLMPISVEDADAFFPAFDTGFRHDVLSVIRVDIADWQTKNDPPFDHFRLVDHRRR